MGSLFGNPYVLLLSLVVGFGLGFGLCWPIGTYRVDRVQIINLQSVVNQQNEAIAQSKATLQNWQEQANKNALDAQKVIDEQRRINDAANKAQITLQNSIVGIQNAAKNLPTLNCKLDDGYQQLLSNISQAANSPNSNSAPAKTTSPINNSKSHSAISKSQNWQW